MPYRHLINIVSAPFEMIGHLAAGVSVGAVMANEHALAIAASVVAVGGVVVPAVMKWWKDVRIEAGKIAREEHVAAIQADSGILAGEVIRRAELEVHCKALQTQLDKLQAQVALNTARTDQATTVIAAVRDEVKTK